MQHNRTKLIGAALAALMLAGCGGTPTAPKSKRPSAGSSQLLTGPGQVPGAVPGMPQPGMAPAAGNPEGAQLLQGMRNLLPTISGFDVQVRSYSQGHYKAGAKVEELRKSTTEARIIWARPMKLRAEVIQTTNPLLVGAAMATPDGQNITARAKGVLGLFPIKMAITDPKLGNNRNHKLTQNNPKALLERLTAPTATWTVIGEQTVEGTPCKLIQVDNVSRLDKEINRELVAIDPSNLALRKLVMYNGNTRLVDHTLVKFRWNPKVSSSSFNI